MDKAGRRLGSAASIWRSKGKGGGGRVRVPLRLTLKVTARGLKVWAFFGASRVVFLVSLLLYGVKSCFRLQAQSLCVHLGDQGKGLRVQGEMGKQEFVFKDPEISLGTARKRVAVFVGFAHYEPWQKITAH